jgi:hypothetical protein
MAVRVPHPPPRSAHSRGEGAAARRPSGGLATKSVSYPATERTVFSNSAESGMRSTAAALGRPSPHYAEEAARRRVLPPRIRGERATAM